MIAEKYIDHEHYNQVCAWAISRKLKAPPSKLLPQTGRIVSGHAAVFLYRTDSQVGFIENLISNPDARSASDAIDLCLEAIEQDAQDLGVSLLWGSTYIPGVADRVRRRGFRVSNREYRLVTKELS
jgi:hypothetical protein